MRNKTHHRIEILLMNGCTYSTIETFSLKALKKALAIEIVDAIELELGDLTIRYIRNGKNADPDAWRKIL